MLQAWLLPQKLLFAALLWVVPYCLLSNYLERSLFPFRALCYTQSDLLSSKRPSDREACIRRFHPHRDADPNCHLERRPQILFEPKLNSISNQVVVIRTAPGSVDYRNFIRSSWKDDFSDTPVIFVCGTKDGVDVSEEARRYGDILQFNFTDTYHNLIYKMMSIYGYFLDEVQDVHHIIVVNDDTIVNATAVSKLPFRDPNEKWVIGKVSRGYPRLWMPWLTWHVPAQMYPNMCYPRFIQGSSFIVSRAAARELLQNVCKFPWIHLDDVHMGVMLTCLGIRQLHHEGFDHHTFDEFVVYHYQYSRHSAGKLHALWDTSTFNTRE